MPDEDFFFIQFMNKCCLDSSRCKSSNASACRHLLLMVDNDQQAHLGSAKSYIPCIKCNKNISSNRKNVIIMMDHTTQENGEINKS